MYRLKMMWDLRLMVLMMMASIAGAAAASDKLSFHASIFLGDQTSNLPAKVGVTWGDLRLFLMENPNARISDLEVELTCDGARYTAVFAQGLGQQIINVGMEQSAFYMQNTRAALDGYQLSDFDVELQPDGEVRYNAVWSQSSLPAEFVDGLDNDQLDLENRYWQSLGFYLSDLETYDPGDGSVMYAGVWKIGSASSVRVSTNLTWNQFHHEYHNQGDLSYRLVDLEQQPDDRFAAIFKPSSAADYMMVGFGAVGEDALLGNEDCGILVSENLIDYEVIRENTTTESIHPQPFDCFQPGDLTPYEQMPSVRMFNDLPLDYQAKGQDHQNLAALHHGGSTGPGD